MIHPLVEQLRFTRGEWTRGLAGVTEDDASRHFARMNCISWIVGHLAWQEQRYWLDRAKGQLPFPNLNEMYAYGAPMSTPSLKEMLDIWRRVTEAADRYLDERTTEALQSELLRDGETAGQTVGSAMRRMTYHYWFHIGEIQAIRQMLGQSDLPEYVGDIEAQAPYRPE
ncbi:MAG: DinB family protein [Chloroflexota bacterium]|nr:DinB family protein [Chloroflexota bacterium]